MPLISEIMKQKFKDEVKKINNQEIRDFTLKALDLFPEPFWNIPASSTLKYHPVKANEEGGLCWHTLAALRIYDDFLQNEVITGYLTPEQKDICRSALIIHDCCKLGLDGKRRYTDHNHPLLVSNLLASVETFSPYKELILDAVASHMGPWRKGKDPNDSLLPECKGLMQKIVHFADYMASRRYIDIDRMDI